MMRWIPFWNSAVCLTIQAGCGIASTRVPPMVSILQVPCHLALFFTLVFVNTLAGMASKSIRISAAGVRSANGLYLRQSPSNIPEGFAKVCRESRWNTVQMWNQLTDSRTPWYLMENDAYIYFNRGDGKWWIDAPEGHGLYIARFKTCLNITYLL